MDDEFGIGRIMLFLAAGSVVAGLLAIAIYLRISRHFPRSRSMKGLTVGLAPYLAGLVAGFAGFFVVIFLPEAIYVPAAFFAVWAIGIWWRRGVQAALRGGLLLVLALLWRELAIYGERMNLWSATVIAPIRVDLMITAPMAAVWGFLSVWLGREINPLEAEEEVEEREHIAPDGRLTAGIRKR